MYSISQGSLWPLQTHLENQNKSGPRVWSGGTQLFFSMMDDLVLTIGLPLCYSVKVCTKESMREEQTEASVFACKSSFKCQCVQWGHQMPQWVTMYKICRLSSIQEGVTGIWILNFLTLNQGHLKKTCVLYFRSPKSHVYIRMITCENVVLYWFDKICVFTWNLLYFISHVKLWFEKHVTTIFFHICEIFKVICFLFIFSTS